MSEETKQGRNDDGRFIGNEHAPVIKPPDSTEPTPPAKIVNPSVDIDPNVITKDQAKTLIEERNTMAEQMLKMQSTLDKQDQREQQKIYEKAREVKMEKLRELNPKLADKHKDTSDLEKIDLLIDTAESFKNDFTEYNKGKGDGDKKKKGPVFRIDLKTGLPTN